MSKDQARRTRRSTGERSAHVSVRRPKRARSQPDPTANREMATGRGLASLAADRRGGLAQDLTLLSSALALVVASAFRHVRIWRFRAALAGAQQLVCKHPLRAVLIGVGLGYLLSRTKVS